MHKPSWVLSASVVATTAASVWLWGRWQDEHTANLELHARVAGFTRQAERALAAAPMVTNAEVSEARATKAIAEPRPAMSAPPANYPGKLQQRLLKNPKFRLALRSQQRVALETQFRDLPKFLGLSTAEADRIFDLLAEQGVRLLELQWRGPWSSEEGWTRQDSHRELRKQSDAELANLLGAPNMNRFQEFRSTLQSREEVAAVRGEMALGLEPLREDQVEPMILLVNSELQRMNQELRDLAMAQEIPDEKRGELAIAANARIVEAARPILSSAQITALKELYRRQGIQMQAQAELNRLRVEAATSNSQTAPN